MAAWRWDLLTHVGFFSLAMGGMGTFTEMAGWDGEPGQTAVTEAHAHGVAIVPVITCFDAAAIHDVLTTHRTEAVEAIAAAVNDRGADGVNIDFEGVMAADRAAMVTFAGALRQAMPDGHISFAVPAIDWSNAWDYAGLVAIADRLIVMGYDYHWRNSDPGPVAPLTSGATWDFRNVTWSVDDVVTKSGGHADQVLLGVPLYGFDYPSAGPEIPGTASGAAETIYYRDAEIEVAAYARLWDEASQTPYYLYQDGTSAWHQVWYDDGESLGRKFDLAVDRGLAGGALWALNFESASLWDAIEAHLTTGHAADAGVGEDAGPGTSDAPTTDTPPMMDEGCGCRVGGTRRTPAAAAAAILALLALRGARRRRSRRAS